jgi:glutamine synthetase
MDPHEELLLPTNLNQALEALMIDGDLNEGFGDEFIRYYAQIKSSEAKRHMTSENSIEFDRREYFGRI